MSFAYPKRHRAFTLLEVLLALSLTAIVMVSVTLLIFSISQIWLTRNAKDHFKDHVNGVSYFLNSLIDEALTYQDSESIEEDSTSENSSSESSSSTSSSSVSSESTSEDSDDSTAAITWDKPDQMSRLKDLMISFRLNKAPPLLCISDVRLPNLRCYLYYDEDEGLCLLWHPENFEVDSLYDISVTQISPYVSKLEYCYYEEDKEDWEIEDEPMETAPDEYPLPDFIRLTFSKGEQHYIRKIYIPNSSNDSLSF